MAIAKLAAFVLAAHVSVLQGNATITRAEGGRIVALRNAPVLDGDAFATLSGALGEIEIDARDYVRLDGETSIQMLSLTRLHRVVRLATGTIELSVSENGGAPQVETPLLPLVPDTPGLYRISVAGAITTVLTEHGSLRVITPNGTQYLGPGERLTIDGTSAAPHLHYAAPPPGDAFDAFNQARDDSERGDVFKAYGSWLKLKTYGVVWQPREYSGWAPYRSGRWLWRKDFGWTWIARESWGWIPYHSGTWAYDAKAGWCWVAPAVASVLAQQSSNAVFFAVIVNGRTRSIGWTPLAPGETFHSQLSEYHNAQARGGVTLLDVGAFYSGNFSRLSTPPYETLPADVHMQAPLPPPLHHNAPSARRM